MEFIADLGTNMSRFIFWGSSFLTEEQAPGLISIVILGWLLISVLFVWLSASRKLTALRWLNTQVRVTKDEADFAANVLKITREAKKVRARKGYAHITAAWDEFRETLIEDESDGRSVLRNSVRPSSFFNLEDLYFGPGFSRYMPGLFVTVGLFFTFLGLIAALRQITGLGQASPEEMRASLDGLLGAASAKFIMSLTGLLASIIFTIVLRLFTGRIEGRIHALCAELERRLTFISLEELSMEQLKIARGQKDSFMEIGTTLVAELDRSLQKEIPDSISSSISTAMAPLLDKVGRAGADGVGQMVNDLSSRFSDDVGRALSEASAQLSAAGDKIASLSDRMDQSSGQMGQEMEASVGKLAQAAEDLSAQLASAAETADGTLNAGAEKLLEIMNETLEGIRRNTAEGADALKEAAADMRASAGTFREELDAAAASGSDAVRSRMETAGSEAEGAISEAGRGMADLVTRTGQDLLSASGEFREKIRADLIDPITEVMDQLDKMADRLKDGSGQIATAAGHIRSGGDGADGLRRMPRWMLDALEVADRFRADTDLDEHWAALARFRRALEPGVRMEGSDPEARVGMTDFFSGLEVTLTDRFSISPRGEDQFAIVPFLGETVEAAEREGEQVSEAEAELQEGRLRAFQDRAFARGARPAYKLGAQSYLVVDPAAAPVLKVMTEMQRADPVTRAAFVRNPCQRITEAVTDYLRSKGKLEGLTLAAEQELIEQAAESAFVETREYSERVIGLTVYEKPSLEIAGSGTTWLPEAFTAAATETIEAMAPDQIQELIKRVETAIATGEPSVSVGEAEIPATRISRAALEQRLEQVLNTEESEKRPVEEEDRDQRTGPIILDTAANLDELTWAAKISPRKRLAPSMLPEVVKSSLKGHQTESFRWKLEAWEAGLSGVLNADEQGLGKTLQAIAFLAWMKKNMSRSETGRAGPVLVVAPTSLLVNWEEEVDKHLRAPGLGNVVRLYGSALGGRKRPGLQGVETESGNAVLDLGDIREAIQEGRGHRYWVLTTYTTLTNYQHSLAKVPFSTAVFDEIQAVKNPVSLRAKAALAVNADFRIGLTGTPIENSTTDLWAIMEQLTPGRFGSLKVFRERFGEPEEGNMRELYARMFEMQGGLPPVALRRLKEGVARDLPEKTRRLHPRLMPDAQAAAYEKARGALASRSRGGALKMLHHIRSVSVHPDAASPAEDETYIGMSARLVAAMEILRGIRDRGERALVFIEHVKMQHRFIELVKREFRLARVDLINGSTPIPRRQEIVNRFQRHLDRDEGFDLLVLSPKAAGTGLTLTAATHVIHLSRWWNPAVEEQCNDRVHRIGQMRPVTVHVPMAIHPGYQQNSFDCLLHSLMTRKRRLATSALWPMGDTEEDANRLQAMLADCGTAASGDPVGAAMELMFKRDGAQIERRNPDGSIGYR